MSAPRRVLFVCMGNICRSPLAEGIARHQFAAQGIGHVADFDSAGTHAYHVGNPPDPRAIAVARERGVDISGLRARQVAVEDFGRFDLMLAADADNLARLRRLRPAAATAATELLLPWAGLAQREVPDPYYGGQREFEAVFALLARAAEGLAQRLR
jgi:protein-tyrosine phosphatase